MRDRRRFGPAPTCWGSSGSGSATASRSTCRRSSRSSGCTGYFLRAGSFFNVAQFVDSAGTFSPDLSLYDALDTLRLMRGFLEAPERYLRAALEDG